MVRKKKKEKNSIKYKTIKIDQSTHKLLKMYAAENDLFLGEAVKDLLEEVQKIKK